MVSDAIVLPLPKQDECFLCGEHLADHASDEHVFPKWLLNRVNLWDKTIALLNESTIPYRSLTVPCCLRCNNEHLSKLEAKIAQAFDGGVSSVRGLDPDLIFQWCSKVLYGLLYKELSLAADIKKRDGEKIGDRQFLEDLKMFRYMVQSIRFPTTFVGSKPYSLFIFETHSYPDEEQGYFFDDCILAGTLDDMRLSLIITFMLNGTGVICVLQDNGALESVLGKRFAMHFGHPLFRTQFLELAAITTYKESIRLKTGKFAQTETPDCKRSVICFPITGRIYDTWKCEDAATILGLKLAHGAGINVALSDLYHNGRVWTILDENGKSLELDASGNRVKQAQ